MLAALDVYAEADSGWLASIQRMRSWAMSTTSGGKSAKGHGRSRVFG
jgi:hypothetical protein